ncbi:MAG: sugar transferase [Rikenellaceae bacterium]
MRKHFNRDAIIVLFDVIISLFSFWICGLFLHQSHCSWLVMLSVIWVIIGILTGKLNFSKYKNLKYAVAGLMLIDLFSSVLLFLLYKNFAGVHHYSILVATSLIFLFESLLYYVVRTIYCHKLPYLYTEQGTNPNIENIRNIEIKSVENPDVNIIIDFIKKEPDDVESIFSKLSDTSVVFDTSNPMVILQDTTASPSLIIHNKALNNIKHINTLFAYTNNKLKCEGYVVCKCVTSGIRNDNFTDKMPNFISKIICLMDYIVNRVMPKLMFIKSIYYWLTKGERRVLTRVEVLGRLYRAGFEVIYEKIHSGKLYIVAQRKKEPMSNDTPSYGIFICLKRTGLNGKDINVYKFRTMHAYSEYLQPYIYKTEGLTNDSCRYNNDYRVSALGRLMRKLFVDELPMIINLIKGDLKLVGVRPLSAHYLSLYADDTIGIRQKVKPGLFPPFYADLPESIEEKQESEKRYIESYLNDPIQTDWIYFWKIFINIIFKGYRSE